MDDKLDVALDNLYDVLSKSPAGTSKQLRMRESGEGVKTLLNAFVYLEYCLRDVLGGMTKPQEQHYAIRQAQGMLLNLINDIERE